ncbi:hypothetical protein HNP38_000221 [Chryseobacterium defluvii]|uniref:Uncharacterized protein n=1 Tax=Chryseobacterium defluvii TaxID=160396 RepID=A0A840K6V2_9FLAO|nr:hypothetical protein [Chryseobacterium defluvii]MBB4804949.1 hypothetical protein [Chryseobacterium defluvii]
MITWTTYTTENPLVKLNDLTSKYIIKALGQALTTFFSFDTTKRPQRTTLIKDTLTELGDKKLNGKPSYKVYSHGLSNHLRQSNGGKYKNTEWLYDLHWYTEADEPYIPTSLPLVVECEWNPKRKGDNIVPYSGIKYDFQKLLVANADLRLMIFIIKKDNDIFELDQYFDRAIDNYAHLKPNSKFLFIAFDERIKGFHYINKLKNEKPLNIQAHSPQ